MKKLQSGRSMVEMLGVLAIIGVLSIGGIAGYTLSMRRYRANNILDAVAKYSVIAYSNCQKEVLNGTINSLHECRSTNVVSFADASIGDIPAGVDAILFSSVLEKASSGDTFSNAVILFKSGDEGKKLCQSALSITGTKKKFIRHDGMSENMNICDNDNESKLLNVLIRQN